MLAWNCSRRHGGATPCIIIILNIVLAWWFIVPSLGQGIKYSLCSNIPCMVFGGRIHDSDAWFLSSCFSYHFRATALTFCSDCLIWLFRDSWSPHQSQFCRSEYSSEAPYFFGQAHLLDETCNSQREGIMRHPRFCQRFMSLFQLCYFFFLTTGLVTTGWPQNEPLHSQVQKVYILPTFHRETHK